MMHRTVVINVVGLTGELLGPHTPHLSALAREGAQASLHTVLPAVTCSAQATFLTGAMPTDHGIIDPRDTRKVLGFALETCLEGRARELRPNSFGVARA